MKINNIPLDILFGINIEVSGADDNKLSKLQIYQAHIPFCIFYCDET
jgi:hypothetical protein